MIIIIYILLHSSNMTIYDNWILLSYICIYERKIALRPKIWYLS
jgi:hypothetical protein